MAQAGLAIPLRRLGIQDQFAESGSREFLFARYGLDTQTVLNAAWQVLGRRVPVPNAKVMPTAPGAYAPV